MKKDIFKGFKWKDLTSTKSRKIGLSLGALSVVGTAVAVPLAVTLTKDSGNSSKATINNDIKEEETNEPTQGAKEKIAFNMDSLLPKLTPLLGKIPIFSIMQKGILGLNKDEVEKIFSKETMDILKPIVKDVMPLLKNFIDDERVLQIINHVINKVLNKPHIIKELIFFIEYDGLNALDDKKIDKIVNMVKELEIEKALKRILNMQVDVNKLVKPLLKSLVHGLKNMGSLDLIRDLVRELAKFDIVVDDKYLKLADLVLYKGFNKATSPLDKDELIKGASSELSTLIVDNFEDLLEKAKTLIKEKTGGFIDINMKTVLESAIPIALKLLFSNTFSGKIEDFQKQLVDKAKQIKTLKTKEKQVKEDIDEINKLYDEINKIENTLLIKAKISDASINFDDVWKTSFLRGNGILKLTDKEVKEFIFGAIKLVLDFPNTLDEILENVKTGDFVADFGKSFIKDIGPIKDIKNHEMIKKIGALDINKITDIVIKLKNQGLAGFEYDDYKFIIETASKFINNDIFTKLLNVPKGAYETFLGALKNGIKGDKEDDADLKPLKGAFNVFLNTFGIKLPELSGLAKLLPESIRAIAGSVISKITIPDIIFGQGKPKEFVPNPKEKLFKDLKKYVDISDITLKAKDNGDGTVTVTSNKTVNADVIYSKDGLNQGKLTKGTTANTYIFDAKDIEDGKYFIKTNFVNDDKVAYFGGDRILPIRIVDHKIFIPKPKPYGKPLMLAWSDDDGSNHNKEFEHDGMRIVIGKNEDDDYSLDKVIASDVPLNKPINVKVTIYNSKKGIGIGSPLYNNWNNIEHLMTDTFKNDVEVKNFIIIPKDIKKPNEFEKFEVMYNYEGDGWWDTNHSLKNWLWFDKGKNNLHFKSESGGNGDDEDEVLIKIETSGIHKEDL